MFFDELKSAISDYMDKIHQHPFNQGLSQGTLPIKAFQQFVSQDKLYLMDFSIALQQTAARALNHNHKHLLMKLSDYVKGESSFFDQFLPTELTSTSGQTSEKNFVQTTPHPPFGHLLPMSGEKEIRKEVLWENHNTFFKPVSFASEKGEAVTSYTHFLLTNSEHHETAQAVASLLPCFYIYKELGIQMSKSTVSNNPFQAWIDTYSDPLFIEATECMIKLINELTTELNPAKKAILIDVFVQSTRFELSFWDSVYPQFIAEEEETLPAMNSKF